MIISRKDYESLKKKVEEIEKQNAELWQGYVFMRQELDELKKPSKPSYFG